MGCICTATLTGLVPAAKEVRSSLPIRAVVHVHRSSPARGVAREQSAGDPFRGPPARDLDLFRILRGRQTARGLGAVLGLPPPPRRHPIRRTAALVYRAPLIRQRPRHIPPLEAGDAVAEALRRRITL